MAKDDNSLGPEPEQSRMETIIASASQQIEGAQSLLDVLKGQTLEITDPEFRRMVTAFAENIQHQRRLLASMERHIERVSGVGK